jgi:hypothetical protein
MWAVYLFAGIATGATITFLILWLISLRHRCTAVDDFDVQAPTELAKFSKEAEIQQLLALGEESELTDNEIAEYTAEDASVDTALLDAEEKAADTGEYILDADTVRWLEEAEKEREAFVKAKFAGAKAPVPSLRFTLSREDVLDYMDDMWQKLSNGGDLILPSVIERKKKYTPDVLRCGEWCFSLMYEKSKVIKLIVRVDEKTATEIAKKHPTFKTAAFPGGEGWYDLIVDQSFKSKQEVYDILDAAYLNVFSMYYSQEGGRFVTDREAAQADASKIAAEVAENENTADPAYDSAIQEYAAAYEKFREKRNLPFVMTRKRMLHYVEKRSKKLAGSETVKREKRYLPASLNWKGKTYALVYEKIEKADPSKTYVSLIVRVSDSYAKWLEHFHPTVCRARFPKNRNWYVVSVDGSFRNAQMVYRVLHRAKHFVESK